ncbi:glycogen debranching enzyme GlgX [Melaminivora suipulveris]|uniref:Glycogen debranching enzyme GlgX n=1 Tax=Melaminivora suipulveris TaxID=2109913 RepID=A0A2R3Q845_9BURK|nr:glycogen debranching protein GlgX [Melaminivora suipulveris]AVO47958.1 glycogen debranching enzyme GlgX [Melaminivora suipulveris]
MRADVAHIPALVAPRPRRLHPHVTHGRAWPLGATVEHGGVNFAVYSSVATRVEVCLYDEHDRERARIALPGCTHGVWHGHVRGLKAGQRYGLRVQGPYDPEQGLRCNPAKLLLDPCALALDRPVRGNAGQFGYELGQDDEDAQVSSVDNGPHAPKCRVAQTRFDWQGDAPPRVPPEDTVLYEVHVKGFTRSMPGVPEELRGTYAGLAHGAAIAHLKTLGVTSVELLPVQAFIDDQYLVDRGLVNYWGYNTVAFFAPEPRYCVGGDGGVDEFKAMVRALHRAGLEVILDVVYNHTGEGNHLGPTLSLKGIDNPGYYRLAQERRHYVDFGGVGNTVDASSPPALRLIADSLRYWVTEMHVDGFRFDLASALGRDEAGAYTVRAQFFAALHQDPVLSRVKLIAEPWDLGPYGYQVGHFPVGWQEWNGRYRDAVRDYWRSSDGSLPQLAAALCGSRDLYEPSGRPPTASVNLVTVHDGFTLADLVSYEAKRNEANGEDNRDGIDDNRSWNCGAEGPTQEAAILALRARQVRNLLTTLLLSHGTPLLLGGDEFGRTQHGNNNGYCQDSALTWHDWTLAGSGAGRALQSYVQALLSLRRALPVVRPAHWPHEHDERAQCAAVRWFSVWGLPMSVQEWDDPLVRCVCAVMQARSGQSLMLLFNATPNEATFTLPQQDGTPGCWHLRIDTREAQVLAPDAARRVAAGEQVSLLAHSMVVLTGQALARSSESQA